MIKLEDFGVPRTSEGRELRRMLVKLINGAPSAKKDDLTHLLSVANSHLNPVEEVAPVYSEDDLKGMEYKELCKIASSLNIKRGKADDMIAAIIKGE